MSGALIGMVLVLGGILIGATIAFIIAGMSMEYPDE